MNGTPRLRSAFPSSPPQQRASGWNGTPTANRSNPSAGSGTPKMRDLKSLSPQTSQPNAPLIPFETVDAPQQRLYAVTFWFLLFFWRFYDFYHLTLDETESLWLFMKWVSIDGVFLYGLPGLRIPWMEWSSTTMTVLFLVHAFFDGVLMFRIPIPFGTALVALSRLLYDREIAISERRVKHNDLLHNPSLILGRQIIHVLPEGSARLNPEGIPLCLDTSKYSPSVQLPIQINQTNPTSIELVRHDFASLENETIIITASQAKKMRKDAEKGHKVDPDAPLTLHYPIKKPGLYRLSRVIDETKLEVQKRSSGAMVVNCPAARLISSGPYRCRGDLSDLSIEVEGTPPLQVKYRCYTDLKNEVRTYESILPDGFNGPTGRSQSLVTTQSLQASDFIWAQSQTIKVPLNETVLQGGTWSYAIQEITDSLNNTVAYTIEEEGGKPTAKKPHSEASFYVHERPRVSLDSKVGQPLRVAEGHSIGMPLNFQSTGKKRISGVKHTVQWLFSPLDNLTTSGEHGTVAQTRLVEIASEKQEKPPIQEPGLYTLQSVSTPFCQGEVREPASCVLVNPPRPSLSLFAEQIVDRCEGKGKPVGLHVSLDLSGTPPFRVKYQNMSGTATYPSTHTATIRSLRGTLEFKPEVADEYTYVFMEVSDDLYPATRLSGEEFTLRQNVKPSVSASFSDPGPPKHICIDEAVSYAVKLQGERPFVLEYELIRNGKRYLQKKAETSDDLYEINTGKLTHGGEHTLALVSVTDALGCKSALKQEVKIVVRHQRPRVSFGAVEDKYDVRMLEGKEMRLPLRLTGEAPWTIDYRMPKDPQGATRSKTTSNANDALVVSAPGRYEILGVNDALCSGFVEEQGKQFDVVWIGRPEFHVPTSPLLDEKNGIFVRKDVCEGEEDALDIYLNGKAPFEIQYNELLKNGRSTTPVHSHPRKMTVPLQSAQIKMDTTRAGSYEYVFSQLSDANYDEMSKHKTLKIEQQVHPRPSADFANPGKVYSFCQGQAGQPEEEVIPIKLTGKAPFHIDVELKGHAKSARPQTITIPYIPEAKHSLHIPHHYLSLGNSALTIRRVRDAHGCELLVDPASAPRVQLAVHEPPSITPLEQREHVCVGERISYALGGVAPFAVFYTFGGQERRAAVTGATFRRVAERAGNFTITGVADAASACRAPVALSRLVHDLPGARVGSGRETRVDIHAGGAADIVFDFVGQPPFEFTYTRSETRRRGDRRPAAVLETRTLASDGMRLAISAGDEGTYEVVSIRDRYCYYARPGAEALRGASGRLLKD